MFLENLSEEAGVQTQYCGVISCLAIAVLAAKPLAAGLISGPQENISLVVISAF